MGFDLILRQACIGNDEAPVVDVGVQAGKIAAIAPSLAGNGPEVSIGGRLVLPGFVETHIHLDKSGLLGRCDCHQGTLAEAVTAVTAAKREFTEQDVYERARQTLEKSILQGTMRMRTHVEVDPRIGLTSLHALRRLKADYAWAIDLELCAFPQEGLLDDPGCEDVLIASLKQGATVVGGAPYMDKDSHGQIERIFQLASRFDVDIDFHLDFSLDPSHLDAEEVCRQTDFYGWGGRVTIGHVTKLSALPPPQLAEISRHVAGAGVAVTVLPATDLFLTGRDRDYDVPRGVAPAHRLLQAGVNCSIATNNVLNPFTPFGDCSLVRMANLYANVTQVGSADGMTACLDMITSRPAQLMNLTDYGITVGGRADFVVMDCHSRAQAVAELAPVLAGYRAGVPSFTRPRASLHRPGESPKQ